MHGIPDNRGAQPIRHAAGGPAAYFASPPIKGSCCRCRAAGRRALRGIADRRHLCLRKPCAVRLMHSVGAGRPPRWGARVAALVHVRPGSAAVGEPHLPLRDMVRAASTRLFWRRRCWRQDIALQAGDALKNGRNLANLEQRQALPHAVVTRLGEGFASHRCARCVKSAHARCPPLFLPWPAEPGCHRCGTPPASADAVLYGRTATARRTGESVASGHPALCRCHKSLCSSWAWCRAWRTLRPSSTDSAWRVWVASPQ